MASLLPAAATCCCYLLLLLLTHSHGPRHAYASRADTTLPPWTRSSSSSRTSKESPRILLHGLLLTPAAHFCPPPLCASQILACDPRARRWTSWYHPDPAGEQISALKYSLNKLIEGKTDVKSNAAVHTSQPSGSAADRRAPRILGASPPTLHSLSPPRPASPSPPLLPTSPPPLAVLLSPCPLPMPAARDELWPLHQPHGRLVEAAAPGHVPLDRVRSPSRDGTPSLATELGDGTHVYQTISTSPAPFSGRPAPSILP